MLILTSQFAHASNRFHERVISVFTSRVRYNQNYSRQDGSEHPGVHRVQEEPFSGAHVLTIPENQKSMLNDININLINSI